MDVAFHLDSNASFIRANTDSVPMDQDGPEQAYVPSMVDIPSTCAPETESPSSLTPSSHTLDSPGNTLIERPTHGRIPLPFGGKGKALRCNCPGTGESDEYAWPLTPKSNGFDPGRELLDTLMLVSKETEMKPFFSNDFAKEVQSVNRDSWHQMQSLVQRFNDCLKSYHNSHNNAPPLHTCSSVLLQHIMTIVYNRSITDPGKLNRYKGWSEEVYGEFSASMISEIVQKVPIRSSDCFIDLGSGVGQVVLQVAGEGLCVSAYGIEKQDNPAMYAKDMQKQFESRMSWFGKRHGKYEIFHGDFLEDAYIDKINDADVIFVNNFAFGTRLNQLLKERFANAKEGARIVSSLNFSPMNFTITERTLGDIGAILSIKKVTCTGEGVSWTSRPFDYYIHTVDRSKLEAYFQQEEKRPIFCSVQPEEQAKIDAEQKEKMDADVSNTAAVPSPGARVPTPWKKTPLNNNNLSTIVRKRPSTDQIVNHHSKIAKPYNVNPTGVSKHLGLGKAGFRHPNLDKNDAASPHEQYNKGLTGSFIKKWGGPSVTVPGRSRGAVLAQELQPLAVQTERSVKDLQRYVATLQRQSLALQEDNNAALVRRFTGLATNLGSSCDPATSDGQISLACDVVVRHEKALRLQQEMQREVSILTKQDAQLSHVVESLNPLVGSLARILDFAKLNDGWDWSNIFSPSQQAVTRIRQQLQSQKLRGGVKSTLTVQPPDTAISAPEPAMHNVTGDALVTHNLIVARNDADEGTTGIGQVGIAICNPSDVRDVIAPQTYSVTIGEDTNSSTMAMKNGSNGVGVFKGLVDYDSNDENETETLSSMELGNPSPNRAAIGSSIDVKYTGSINYAGGGHFQTTHVVSTPSIGNLTAGVNVATAPRMLGSAPPPPPLKFQAQKVVF